VRVHRPGMYLTTHTVQECKAEICMHTEWGCKHACMNAEQGRESTCAQNIWQTHLRTKTYTYEGHELSGY
jgi:hypothetical protein